MQKGKKTRIDFDVKNLDLIVYLIGISCKGKNPNLSVYCVFILIWEKQIWRILRSENIFLINYLIDISPHEKIQIGQHILFYNFLIKTITERFICEKLKKL